MFHGYIRYINYFDWAIFKFANCSFTRGYHCYSTGFTMISWHPMHTELHQAPADGLIADEVSTPWDSGSQPIFSYGYSYVFP